MSTINNGGPAFPLPAISHNGQVVSLTESSVTGMTLRDYFAAKAMQGMAASKEHCTDGWAHSDIAIQAYDLADAMLQARKEK